jgi:hypothetical protein
MKIQDGGRPDVSVIGEMSNGDSIDQRGLLYGVTADPRGILAAGAAMNDEPQELRNGGYKPVLVGPQPFSLEEILRNVSPAPDEETERFVATIYAERRQVAEDSPSE